MNLVYISSTQDSHLTQAFTARETQDSWRAYGHIAKLRVKSRIIGKTGNLFLGNVHFQPVWNHMYLTIAVTSHIQNNNSQQKKPIKKFHSFVLLARGYKGEKHETVAGAGAI